LDKRRDAPRLHELDACMRRMYAHGGSAP